MSTEMMKFAREELIEAIRDINPDMLDKFPEEEIADLVTDIAMKLGTRKGKVIVYPLTSCGGVKNYQIKVSNTLGGFVSCADEDTGDTGVSETLYYPFFVDDEEGVIAGLRSLVEMINEAWYHANN
jgi:hypothetical protein